MRADILRQDGVDNPTTINDEGSWAIKQDPESGEVIRVWQSNPVAVNPDIPSNLESFVCSARAIIDGGIRVAGTTERFNSDYYGSDWVKLIFPANVQISRRDRITNIRDSSGKVLWIEEESETNAPTIFNVNGVSPLTDPFGRHIQSFALLERIELQ